MKNKNYLFLLLAIICMSSCVKKLPESYGIYADSGKEMNSISPQKLVFRGNLFSSISGLNEATGSCFANIEDLIVFQKDVNPQKILLTKLKFQRSAMVSNLFGNSYINVNLWTAEKNIEIKIAPIDGKMDMYRIIPASPLQQGFYALNFGELANKETLSSVDKVVYGFVVGTSIKPYQTTEDRENSGSVSQQSSNNNASNATTVDSTVVAVDEVIGQQDFYEKSKELLSKVNGFFNSKNYVDLRKIYLNADGSDMQDADWNKLVIGFKNWSSQAGKIISSDISEYNYEMNKGTFKLKTNYIKAGTIDEEFVVVYKNNSYYITFIGTK
jgi:hypothetical protein